MKVKVKTWRELCKIFDLEGDTIMPCDGKGIIMTGSVYDRLPSDSVIDVEWSDDPDEWPVCNSPAWHFHPDSYDAVEVEHKEPEYGFYKLSPVEKEQEYDTFDERPLERKKPASVFTDDSDRRKEFPVYSLLMYFPKSLAALTALAVEGNKKHSPDRDPCDLEWVRDKSSDHKECIARHMIDGDWVELAMRAMMNLEVELENGYEKS